MSREKERTNERNRDRVTDRRERNLSSNNLPFNLTEPNRVTHIPDQGWPVEDGDALIPRPGNGQKVNHIRALCESLL